MNVDNCLSIISSGESLTVEFKQSFDKEAIETITAFSNTKGGHLLIGVKDSGIVCGVDIGNETIKNTINQQMRQNCFLRKNRQSTIFI